jgi:hypothetical protein
MEVAWRCAMATHSNDEGRPLNPPKADWDRESKADWDREVQAMEVQDKLDTLIWVATTEEPRYTPPSEQERQASRAVGQVEADIPLMKELVKPGVGRSWTGMLFPSLFVLLLLFIAVLAFAMLRPDEQSATPAAPVAPAEVAGPGGLMATACVLDASAVDVEATLTETITKEDSTQTGYRGAVAFTNTTEAAIYLDLRGSQSTGDEPTEGWFEHDILVAPGATHQETVTGQSWTNRDPTWTVYTAYAAYPATDDCSFQVSGDDALDVLARDVPNPLPVGPGS